MPPVETQSNNQKFSVLIYLQVKFITILKNVLTESMALTTYLPGIRK